MISFSSQAEIIRSQKVELESLRKQMEKSVQLQQDFQSELSEIRKNWQLISGGNGAEQVSGAGQAAAAAAAAGVAASSGSANGTAAGATGIKNDVVYNKLELLASAYNDIQDRLYEIDKSWKNNLMFYGVPYAEAEEDDPVLTEEKVTILPKPTERRGEGDAYLT